MKYNSILLLFLLISSYGCGFDCESYLEKEIKPLNIQGIVLSKNKGAVGCFGNVILKNVNEYDTITNICYCTPDSGTTLWKYVEIGDSLFKDSQSLTVEVYRRGSIKKFHYPCCKY